MDCTVSKRAIYYTDWNSGTVNGNGKMVLAHFTIVQYSKNVFKIVFIPPFV